MTAVIGKLPPKHMSQRAVWWLRHCNVIMPGDYPTGMKVGVPACVAYRAKRLAEDERERFIRQLGGPLTAPAVGFLDREERFSSAYWLSTAARIITDETGFEPKCIHRWDAGVQDIRAYYINQMTATVEYIGDYARMVDGQVTVYRLHAKPSGGMSFKFGMHPATLPTCGECKVEFDKALQNYTPKTGRYPTAVRGAKLDQWKELK